MKRDVRRLAEDEFDICILGGGINGLATAWDAASRGLKVALVERGDFGAKTSAKSLKILHGGLRYLQHLDFSRMRESIQERRSYLRMAPHLVEPLGFLVPTYPGWMKSKLAMGAALWVNDRIRGRDPLELQIPSGKILSREDVLERAPEVPQDKLTGGALFYDLRMKNSDRLTLAFALSAANEAGACLVNYCEGEAFELDGECIRALHVRDLESDERFSVRAKQFAAMTGPWRSLLPNFLRDNEVPTQVVKSAGIQLITRRELCPGSGLAVPSAHVDPDSRLSRGGRHYFTTPWRGHTIWGTTDTTFEGDPDTWRIRESDVHAFIEELNECLPGLNLKRDEVLYVFGGLRMMNEGNQHSGSQVSRRYELYDHESDLGIENLVSMDGVKYTACRIMAEKAVDLLQEKLGGQVTACTTAERPLFGGEFDDLGSLVTWVSQKIEALGWGRETAEVLVELYGSQWDGIPDVARRVLDSGLIEGTAIPRAVIHHAVESECALHLDDILLRRTPLGTLGHPGEQILGEVGNVMGNLLGWTVQKQEDERKRVEVEYEVVD